MIRAALELIALTLFIGMLLMWSALLAHAQYYDWDAAQRQQFQPQQQWMPPPPPVPPMFQPPPVPMPQTTTCYRQFNGYVTCTTR